MATMQQKLSLRSGSTASLVAARPLAHHFCFQPVVAKSVQQRSFSRVQTKAMASGVVVVADMENLKKPELPAGYHIYETLMILKPTLSDEERDRELAKFEAYLNKQECLDIQSNCRGRSKLAYPIKNEWEGIYVLYTYKARRQTARAVQLLLSNPEAGAEDTVARHITKCLY